MRSFLRDSYDRSAAGYDERFRGLQATKYSLLWAGAEELLAPAFAGGRVLDLGCGTGLFSDHLASLALPKAKVVGLDGSFDMAKQACGRASYVVQGDGECLPFCSGAFDAVVAVTVVRIVAASDGRIVGEVARVLKPGGVFALTVLAASCDAGLRETLAANGLAVQRQFPCGQDVAIVGALSLRDNAMCGSDVAMD